MNCQYARVVEVFALIRLDIEHTVHLLRIQLITTAKKYNLFTNHILLTLIIDAELMKSVPPKWRQAS